MSFGAKTEAKAWARAGGYSAAEKATFRVLRASYRLEGYEAYVFRRAGKGPGLLQGHVIHAGVNVAPEPLESGHGVWLKPSHAARGLLDCGYASSAGYCFKEGFSAAVYGFAVLHLFQVLRAETWEAVQMFRCAQGWISLSRLYSLQGGAKRAEPTENVKRLSLRPGRKAGSSPGPGPWRFLSYGLPLAWCNLGPPCSLHSVFPLRSGHSRRAFIFFQVFLLPFTNFEDGSSVLQTTSLLHALALHCTHLCCTFLVVLHHCCSELGTCAGRRFASVSQSLASPVQRPLLAQSFLTRRRLPYRAGLQGGFASDTIDLMRSVLGLVQVASVLGPLPGARACHLSLSSSFAVL